MLIDRPQVVEGSSIQNATVPSGPTFPTLPNAGELFYLTTASGSNPVGLYSYSGGGWEASAKNATLVAHMADDDRHLTAAQNTLIDAITVTAADINSIPSVTTRVTTTETNLANHIADLTKHLTPAQNTFLDALNLPTLTAAHVNFVTGVTSNIQSQLDAIKAVDSQQSSDISNLQSTQASGQSSLQSQLNAHVADDTRHLTAAQNTLLDGITVDFTQINRLTGLTSYLDTFTTGQTLVTRLTGLDATKLNIDGTKSMTGDLNMGSRRITNLATPTVASDAATKDYVDSFVQGLHWVGSVWVATTQNIALSGLQTIDSIALAAGDRVLVKNQTTASQNGIWVVAAGAWTRANDFNSAIEINNSAVFVLQGATQGKSTWVQLSTVTTVATDPITWSAFSGPVINSAGAGISLGTGGQVSVVEGAGLTFSGNAIVADVHPSGGLMTTLDNATASTDAAAELALTNVGTPGTYRSVTTDAKGRVTSGSNPTVSIAQGGTGAITGPAALTSLGALPIAGGTMTGPLQVKSNTLLGSNSVGTFNGSGSALTVVHVGSGTEYGITIAPTTSTSITNTINFLSSASTPSAPVAVGAIQLLVNNSGLNLSGPWSVNGSSIYSTAGGEMTGQPIVRASDSGMILQSRNTSPTTIPYQFYIQHNLGNVVIGNERGGVQLNGNASTASSVPWSGITARPTRTNWADNAGNDIIAGQLTWRNYNNNHTVFDASSGVSPTGATIDRINPSVGWTETYPTLMGWNGQQTYGVRVDTCRVSDITNQTTIGRVGTLGPGYGSYGSINVAGNTNGWAGISFSDYNATFMVNGSQSGVYRNNNSWDWKFDSNGVLSTGTVPGTSVTGTVASATLAAKASTLVLGGGTGNGAVFNWSGQGGQPTWLWGGSDGVNMYVYNPSNFSVASAGSAGSAARLTGPANVNGTDGWFRSTGAAGWYNSDYAVGIYSSEAGNVRTYNNSRFISNQGSATLPAFSFTNDTDTGFYSESDGYLNITVNGTYRGRFDSAGNLGVNGNFYGGGAGLTGTAGSLTSGNTNSIAGAIGTGYTWSGIQVFKTNKGSGVYSGNTNSFTQFYSDDSGAAGFSFHRGGAYAVNMALDPDNIIRIGGWSASGGRFAFDMGGNFTAAGDVTAFSDERLKTNWRDITTSFVDKWANVKHGVFERIDTGNTQIGLSAQAVQAVVPEAVAEDKDGMLSVNYGAVSAVATVKLAEEVIELRKQLQMQGELIKLLMEKQGL